MQMPGRKDEEDAVMHDLNLLIMVTWKEEGKWRLYRLLKSRCRSVHILQPFLLKEGVHPWIKRCSRLLSEFYLPLIAWKRRKHCDFIISWTMRFGICYGVLNRLFPSKGSAKHVLCDFHINPTRKDPVYRLRLKLLSFSVPGIDFFLCTSTREERIYSEMFRIPIDAIRFFPIAPPGDLPGSCTFPVEDYVFSYGNSDRDYETLLRAAKDFDARVVIVSQAYSPKTALPDSVVLLQDKVAWRDLVRLIAGARVVVMPLQDFNISAGQTAMLETMIMGRPLVVTSNMATVEYATHLQSALFYDAGDAEQLASHVRLLLENRELAEEMGRKAGWEAGRFFDLQASILLDVLQRLAEARDPK